ncbi:MAG: uracil phosphoribosyltransferase [Crocinitomicaceae bacterium]|nr:uracil phosphoribosyltransferase [Crocinitomicaceae bacterium]|tara:strand:+ start:5664 stop:6314 length:651 start_codon:yes stop_codon:yes gene_type:complete
MKVSVLNTQNSIFNVFLSEIRDDTIQKDPLRFRNNIERLGEVLAYEISKSFNYNSVAVQTPLGIAHENLPDSQPVVASVLRAGLPLHLGITRFFDRAENAFVSAYRIEKPGGQLEFKIEYNACPNLEGKTLILADPMLATGNSMWLAYEALLPHGIPKEVHIAAVIGSQQGVDFVKDKFPENTSLYIGAVDPELNELSYIIPGLGDAGDLCFGEKE